MSVAIYQIDRGFSHWMWLCEKHLADKRRAGFEVKERKETPHPLQCDVCRAMERKEPNGSK